MPTTQAPDPAYTLEHAQQDIAGLRGQFAAVGQVVSTVSDKALLLYAPGPNAIPRGPTSWSFEDGTTSGWTAANGAVTNSVVTAAGWPTAGSHSLLLTASGAGQPAALSPAAPPPTVPSFIPSQPGDPVTVAIDIYCPAALNHVYVGIKWRDDTGTLISEIDGPDTVFSAGQVQTLMVSGTAPDLCAGFGVVFGDHNTDPNLTLIYGDNVRVQGNLAISVSAGGGTDPVGNPYPAGIQTSSSGSSTVTNSFGAFLYSSTPAFGNLIMSDTVAGGTDAYGNAYLAGITNYFNTGGGFLAVNVFGGQVGFRLASTAAGPFAAAAGFETINALSLDNTATAFAGNAPILFGLTNGNFGALGNIQAIVSGAAETWHAMSLQNGWANSGAVNAQYRLEPDNSVWLTGDISSGTITNSTAIATALPAAYRPAHVTFIPLLIVAGASAAQQLTPLLGLDTAGGLLIHNVPTGTTRMIFNEKIKLDA